MASWALSQLNFKSPKESQLNFPLIFISIQRRQSKSHIGLSKALKGGGGRRTQKEKQIYYLQLSTEKLKVLENENLIEILKSNKNNMKNNENPCENHFKKTTRVRYIGRK